MFVFWIQGPDWLSSKAKFPYSSSFKFKPFLIGFNSFKGAKADSSSNPLNISRILEPAIQGMDSEQACSCNSKIDFNIRGYIYLNRFIYNKLLVS
jgi:hypothetical protein